MSIYTRFGTPVQLIKPMEVSGWVWVRADLGLNGTADKEVHVSDLKADGGFDEIMQASNALANSNNARKEYEQVYRALRRWNKAAYKGYSPRQTTEQFRNIRSAYPRPIFDAALVSLMESNAYLIYHSTVNDFEETAKIIANCAASEELHERRNREAAFAKATGYDFNYGRYWETMTLQELREAQS